MADTTKLKHFVEEWIRRNHIEPRHPGCAVVPGKVGLEWAGEFAYDAVVRDGSGSTAIGG